MKDKQINLNYSFSLFSFLRRGIGVIIIAILAFMLLQQCNKNEELLGLNDTLTDELEISRNKNGEQVAKIKAYETQRTQDFINFATKDSLTIALQEEVKAMKKYLRRQGSVTNFSTETGVDTSSETEVVDSGDKFFPSYKSKFDLNGWVYGESFATKDSTFLDLKIKNDYTLTVGQERNGFLGLGKPSTFVQVTNKNPYTETQTLKTYQVKMPPPKRFGIGVFAGYGISSDLTVGPIIGVGGSYNLIRF